MKLFGHPLHVMLIHFPSALFPMDLVCSLMGYFTGKPGFAEAAFYSATGGVVIGWIAVVFGSFDLTRIAPHREKVMQKALLHGGINSTVLICYTVFTYLNFSKYPFIDKDSLPIIISKGILVLILIVGNFLGGSLVLKHHLGVEKEEI